MAVAQDPIKKPDMSRNEKLAGKVVYSRGCNVVYNELGYAVRAGRVDNQRFVGTTRSLPAQPIEDALAGKPWVEPDHGNLQEWPWDCDRPLSEEEYQDYLKAKAEGQPYVVVDE